MKQQQRAIAYAEIKAQEQVRSQIGRELHDNINQVLTTGKAVQRTVPFAAATVRRSAAKIHTLPEWLHRGNPRTIQDAFCTYHR
jgi:glucose-6-phosphate-specific signal transduction histidine kinase